LGIFRIGKLHQHSDTRAPFSVAKFSMNFNNASV
jgi:hypothetical protein